VRFYIQNVFPQSCRRSSRYYIDYFFEYFLIIIIRIYYIQLRVGEIYVHCYTLIFIDLILRSVQLSFSADLKWQILAEAGPGEQEGKKP